jgi:hypothetical protein
MYALRRLAGDLGAMVLGILLVGMMLHAAAGQPATLRQDGRQLPLGVGPHSFPVAERPVYSPPGSTDRSPPISERPFAKPFIDRGPALADRPLPPIGGGSQLSPTPAPQVWCQGRWMKAEQAWRSCPSW